MVQNRKFLRRASLLLFAVVFSLVPVVRVHADSTERYPEITMHAGDHGHFADGEHDAGDDKSRTKSYFFADKFDDYTKPVRDDAGYVFAGWSKNPEATSADVELGELTAAQIGTDLYAVWSDTAYVNYQIYNGSWTNPADGNDYTSVMASYAVGAHFQPLSPSPTPDSNVYNFVGWNTDIYGEGDPLTAETVIDEYYIDAYSEWEYATDRIDDELSLDEEKDVTVGVSIPVFKFTAPETAIYEIYTNGIEYDEEMKYQGFIRLRNVKDGSLAKEEYIDPTQGFTDVHLYYEMQAGETYYARFGETDGNYLHFKAGIRKATMKTVTFDSNRGSGAWYGNDHSQTTKEVEVPVGENVIRLFLDDLNYDETKISFNVWQTEPDPDEIHNYCIITDSTDTVYADWTEVVAINLDYNGGHDHFQPEITSKVATYPRWVKFETQMDPDIDDPSKDFAGWSRDPQAAVPDTDIVEGENEATDYDGETFYAVYTDKVLTTYKTTGGTFMMNDPDATSYEASRGTGHIFYGMSVMSSNPRIEHVGWVDDKGNSTSATSDIDGTYHINGDTTFTALLKYKILAEGNGGHFVVGCGLGTCDREPLEISYTEEDSTFSYDDAKRTVGIPVSYEEGKSFIGYATTPDATEPDAIDGVTRLTDLDGVDALYAVWADGPIAYLEDSSETSYIKGSKTGLRLVIKRTDDDSKTFSSFAGPSLDGAVDPLDENMPGYISEDAYDTERGSLILTLHSDYLDSLDSGTHVLSINFNDVDSLDVSIIISDASSSSDSVIPRAPNTGRR